MPAFNAGVNLALESLFLFYLPVFMKVTTGVKVLVKALCVMG